MDLPRVDRDADVAVGEQRSHRAEIRERANERAACELDPDAHVDRGRLRAHRVDRLRDLFVGRAALADDDRVRLTSTERSRGFEHEGTRSRLEVRLARVAGAGPGDERVDFMDNDPRVVEHPSQYLGAIPRFERGAVRLRRPQRQPGEAAAHRGLDQLGKRRASDRRRGEHEVVAPERRHRQKIRETPTLLTSIRRRYSTLVRRVPDERARRRPGDAVRVVVAAVLLTLLALHANDPTAAERALARFFRLLPDDADTFILIFYDLLALWALALVAFALILVRRWRLARDVAAAGALAWVVGRLVSAFVQKTDLAHAFSVTFDLTDVPRFPLVRISMAVAVITVASPYLARPTRRVGQGIVLLLAIATMYLGRSLPADVVGAIVLGWGVAALVHFIFGTAACRPTVDQVARALADLDVPFDDIRATDEQPIARAVFVADGPTGSLRIVAIGRDEADAQLMARIWRWIAYRDAPPTLFPTRRQQVEYEAYTMLLARDAGARVPQVVIAGTSGSLALLVTEDVQGHRLDAGAIDDAWAQVRTLQHTHIAHGRLDAEHLIASEGKVTIVGWERASTGAGDRQLSADVAHLLAATTAIVGPDRAVAAALDGLGSDQVIAALPLLQSGALSGATKSALERSESDDALAELRERARGRGRRGSSGAP